jgi:hypothetical protein
MKIDQTTLFYILLLVTLWLLFFQQKPKTEKYCGACGALAA